MVEGTFEISLEWVLAIRPARKINALLLMNLSSGRALAEACGLMIRVALTVILRVLRVGLMDDENAKEYVLKLVNKRFRIELRLLARILRVQGYSSKASRMCNSTDAVFLYHAVSAFLGDVADGIASLAIMLHIEVDILDHGPLSSCVNSKTDSRLRVLKSGFTLPGPSPTPHKPLTMERGVRPSLWR